MTVNLNSKTNTAWAQTFLCFTENNIDELHISNTVVCCWFKSDICFLLEQFSMSSFWTAQPIHPSTWVYFPLFHCRKTN
jgi:hypothetical protein